MKRLKEQYQSITERLLAAGLRPTRQRILLAALLFDKPCRHITAEKLHREAKDAHVNVSLATIYNTLHQFTEIGLLKEIAVEDGRSCFDTNTDHHHHFFNEDTGELMDIPAEHVQVAGLPSAPDGMSISGVSVVVRIRSDAAA